MCVHIHPHVECPRCGHIQISFWRRSASFRRDLCVFKCSNCGAKYCIPTWCSAVQVVCMLLALAFTYPRFHSYRRLISVISASTAVIVSGAILGMVVPLKLVE